MSSAFTWLPYVDNCCITVRNLECAACFISVYTLMVGISPLFHVAWPQCKNVYANSGLGLAVNIIAIIHMTFGAVLTFCSFLVCILIGNDKPIVKPYIMSVFLFTAFGLLTEMTSMVRMITLNHVCVRSIIHFTENGVKVTEVTYTDFYFLYPYIFFEIAHAMLMIYFAIVVNSYAVQYDSGLIPTTYAETGRTRYNVSIAEFPPGSPRPNPQTAADGIYIHITPVPPGPSPNETSLPSRERHIYRSPSPPESPKET